MPVRMEAQLLKKPHGVSDALGTPRMRPTRGCNRDIIGLNLLSNVHRWMVEAFFRITESLLETRPVLSKYDDTITGHIFSSFLALLLRHELMSSLALRGEKPECADIVRDLAALQEVEAEQDGRRYRLRLPLQGVCGKVFQAVGVAVPSPVRAV
ncbi:MAG: hypothetical protein H5T95_09225 [Firmicutes bacterium]|nr:hypothetical protein [Bacillota bacterium]